MFNRNFFCIITPHNINANVIGKFKDDTTNYKERWKKGQKEPG
jgi:hypothetical protein